jgi:hypothetical protein
LTAFGAVACFGDVEGLGVIAGDWPVCCCAMDEDPASKTEMMLTATAVVTYLSMLIVTLP